MLDMLQLIMIAMGVAAVTVVTARAITVILAGRGKATKEDYELLEELMRKEELRLKALELAEDKIVEYVLDRPHLKSKVSQAMEDEMNRAVKSLLMASLRELYLSALRERLLFYILSFIGGAGTGIILAQVVFRGGS